MKRVMLCSVLMAGRERGIRGIVLREGSGWGEGSFALLRRLPQSRELSAMSIGYLATLGSVFRFWVLAWFYGVNTVRGE